jgi:hypothetical protein
MMQYLPLPVLQLFGFSSVSAIKEQDEPRKSAANVIEILGTSPSYRKSRQNELLFFITVTVPRVMSEVERHASVSRHQDWDQRCAMISNNSMMM